MAAGVIPEYGGNKVSNGQYSYGEGYADVSNITLIAIEYRCSVFATNSGKSSIAKMIS